MSDEPTKPLLKILPRRYFSLEVTVFILLVILSIIGIVITDFSKHDGYTYWSLMVIVFAGMSIFVSWLQAKTREYDFETIVKQQGLHWLHTLLVIGAATIVLKSGQLSEFTASMIILLILALSTMLDGMRIGWQFTMLGFFLAFCAIILAFVEAFLWACISLAVLMVIGIFLWEYWITKQQDSV